MKERERQRARLRNRGNADGRRSLSRSLLLRRYLFEVFFKTRNFPQQRFYAHARGEESTAHAFGYRSSLSLFFLSLGYFYAILVPLRRRAYAKRWVSLSRARTLFLSLCDTRTRMKAQSVGVVIKQTSRRLLLTNLCAYSSCRTRSGRFCSL